VSLYLLDTTVLIDHLRGVSAVSERLLGLLAGGHSLGTCCVNVAELERGVRARERAAARHLVERLRYLDTTREAAGRAGRYQAEFQSRGQTLQTADALIAGTARAHGAILLTANTRDFPMRDVGVEAPV
jgi:predicted nucleic acid-binding protein